MDNDMMSEIMNILETPGTKEKILGMLSSEGYGKDETASVPPPKPAAPAFPDQFTRGSMEAMLQLRHMMERLNRQDDHRIGLLNSIKPFMRNGSEKNIDAAIKFIQILNFAKGR